MDEEAFFHAVLASNERFIGRVKQYLSEHKFTILDLSEASGVPESTLYKLMSNPGKNFRISTFRDMILGIRKLEGGELEEEEDFFAVITSRDALNRLGSQMMINGDVYAIREYPATTIEEEMIQGIVAEREHARGILCGPIAATTLSKIVTIPVCSLRFENTALLRGLRQLSQKL